MSSDDGVERSAISLIKLGGSLITDKRTPNSPRLEVIQRVAAEITALAAASTGSLIVGHGSGSFGHAAASRWRVHLGLREKAQLRGVSETQDSAAKLHRLVFGELRAAGAHPYSQSPSSFLISDAGKPAETHLEPLLRALEVGLLPVVYGDVVMDRERGCSICSTETTFRAVIDGLARRGRQVGRVFWLGETAGIYDAAGALVPRLTATESEALRGAVGGSAGTDVTGGMRHRLDTVVELARLGVESWILDGREPGRLTRAFQGDVVTGTTVVPGD